MKKMIKNSIIAVVATFLLVSFTKINSDKKVVDTSKSTIEWLGKKVTGQHNGTINLKSGFFLYNGKKLVGGEFVVDMTTIVNKDLQGDYKTKLEKHLKSDDFFGVEKFPEATFKIKKVEPVSSNKSKITGDLTIKGKTLEHSFELDFEANKATGKIVIDRSKYDVRYGSGSFFDNLGDKTIYDDFELTVNLYF